MNAERPRRRWALALVCLLAVSGCATGPQDGAASPTPSASSTTGDGSQVIAPILLTEESAEVTARLGIDHVVFVVDDPAEWTATLTPAGLATFVPGGDQGGFTTNPSLELLAIGSLQVVMSGPRGATRDYRINIVEGSDMEVTAKESAAFASTLVGEPEKIAMERILSSGRTYRISMRDGESFPLTMDYSPSRINLEITKGIVDAATVG